MVDVINNISEIHRKNSAKNARDFDLCNRYAKLAEWIVVGFPIVYYTLALAYQLPAFLDILTKGKVRPSMNLYLPGVNELDTIDMIVLSLTNFMLAMFGVTILFASEIFIYINFSTIPMFSMIIQRSIDDFQNELRAKRKPRDLKLIKKQLIEIIEMQLKYNE